MAHSPSNTKNIPARMRGYTLRGQCLSKRLFSSDICHAYSATNQDNFSTSRRSAVPRPSSMMENSKPMIVDSHVHLFKFSNLPPWVDPKSPLYKDEWLSEYIDSIPKSEYPNVKGLVFIEADRRPPDAPWEAISNNVDGLKEYWGQALGEFNSIYQLSQDGKGGELVKGILPWAPMNLGAGGMERYWALLDLGGDGGGRKKMLKGFRYLVQGKPPGTILTPEFTAAMRWIWRKGLVFEVGVDVRSDGVWQLLEAVEAIEEIAPKSNPSDTGGTFVINHLGKPNLYLGPDEVNSDETFKEWSTLLTRIASRPSVVMKFSGLFDELPHDPKFYEDPSSAQKFMLGQIKPWAEEALRIFGTERLLWGSNWPVCNRGFKQMFPDKNPSEAWERWRKLAVQLLKDIGVGEGSEAESAIWWKNTVKVYKLDV